MPRRTTKPKVRKRRYRKVARIQNHAVIGKSLGFPKTNTLQMRFTESFVLNDSIGGVMKTYAFSCNGIHDPNISGSGGQPLGHDQWTQFYNHYRVTKSKINVQYATQSQVANQIPAIIGVYMSDDLTFPINYKTLKESGRGTSRLHGNLDTDTHYLHSTYTQGAFFKGQGKNQSQLGSIIGANPTEQAYFIVYAQSSDLSGVLTNTAFVVDIDYIVEWSEPKDLTAS